MCCHDTIFKKERKNELIPPHIYMCYKTKDVPAFVTRNWETLNPEYTVHLYDDQECEEFLRREYGEKHAEFFRSIPDGPIRSDFWRVCILYKWGGIYVDADVEPLVPLRSFLEDGVSFLTCLSSLHITGGNKCANPHFMAAKSGHPVLKACIHDMLQKHHTPYSYDEWSVTRIMYRQLMAFMGSVRYQEGTYDAHDHSKVQLIQERGNQDEKHSHHVVYKGIRLMNNAYSSYNRDKHTF